MGNTITTPEYPDSRIVETSAGSIIGRRLIFKGEKQVDAFQGIPYAKPPVGELRFAKPEPPDRWYGVKETKEFGPRCYQCIELNQSYVPEGSEDCLYLNVFTPVWEPDNDCGFPVMVFIHGGAFEMGDAHTYGDINICENIVTKGVVFVTIQYRLGYLGFWSTGDAACPGNLGIWDQIAALEWVQQNIEQFGGNKRNVTLIGLSAGGASVDLLHCIPRSTDLFHKAIPMAGTAECRWAMNEKMPAQCKRKAELLGVKRWATSEELLDKLRLIPAEKFAVKYSEGIKDPSVDYETVPVIDFDLIPCTLDVLREQATPKPMMMGVAKEEGLLFILGKKPTEADMNEVIKLTTHEAKDPKELARVIKEKYIGTEIPEDKGVFMRRIARIASDYYVNAGVLELSRRTIALKKEPVYLYVLEHHNPGTMGEYEPKLPIKDATHTSEVQYLFRKGRFATPPFTEADERVTKWFTAAFVNFAKYGNPNGPDKTRSRLPEYWKPTKRRYQGRHFVFGSDGCRMEKEFFGGRTADFILTLDMHKNFQA